MVQEIATACGLAMTAVDGGWSLCAGSAAVVQKRTAERHGGRSLHWYAKIVRIPYAEREPATSRVGPMVLFNHRPTRTKCQRRLAAKIPRFFGNGGFSIKIVGIPYEEHRNAGDGVPYGPNSIRRA